MDFMAYIRQMFCLNKSACEIPHCIMAYCLASTFLRTVVQMSAVQVTSVYFFEKLYDHELGSKKSCDQMMIFLNVVRITRLYKVV